ncbi:hypothetical protein LRS74_22295 [Streptomyces sp. LX-29]|uniref:hypothetical protein n=1 Tax=Streptomyces sp. LX-29 TaxID=2900152 RepID=UPI00240E3722|nr:hypothetical protein [Streptomyces sp. LX-29]WFB11985.1 hypothetical protein LRS74_22295 [Streptomyces sp. LX-29]
MTGRWGGRWVSLGLAFGGPSNASRADLVLPPADRRPSRWDLAAAAERAEWEMERAVGGVPRAGRRPGYILLHDLRRRTHILLSDPATRDDGLTVLDDVARMASHHGLSHQLRSIEGIRRSYDDPRALVSR